MLTGRFGQFEVLGKLGEGGMGEVYRAFDARLHAPGDRGGLEMDSAALTGRSMIANSPNGAR